jgi:hypothetical protein
MPTPAELDQVVFESTQGKMIKRNNVHHPKRANFVIQVYVHFMWRDWSGFRTLAACQNQFPELESAMDENIGRNYRVIEV